MKIMWVSNAPWAPSGYGYQTNLFVKRFRDLGHDVAVVANHGLAGVRLDWDGLTVYPSDGQWANGCLHTYMDHFEPDVTIALCDAWVLRPDKWPDKRPVAVWAPIDHYPIPPPVLAVLAHEQIKPIAMSRFGEGLMTQCELNPMYAPHGVDTQVFKPQPEIREAVREEMGVPKDAFLVTMVAANQGSVLISRKSFPQAFHAFSRFAKHYDDAWLYVHTNRTPPPGTGMDLEKLAAITGCPLKRLTFPGARAFQLGMPPETMAAVYAASDVLLSPSMGEGFGVPMLEAQACGVPVIASDHSAMPEVAQAGWLVTGDPWYDALSESFFIVPFIDSIAACLGEAYQARGNLGVRAAAVKHAAQYDADLVTERDWVPILEQLKPAVQANRAARRAKAKKQAKVAA